MQQPSLTPPLPNPAVRTRIKFCGLVRPQDVRDAIHLGADAIGFVFYEKSPRALDADEALVLRRLLPSWVSAVGLFVNESVDEIRRVSQMVGLDVLQLHGDESPEFAAEVSAACQLPWWRAARCRNQTDLLHCIRQFPNAESLLLDSFSPMFGGTGETFDWAILAEIERSLGPQRYALVRSKMIMSGGLNETNVGQAIAKIQAMAVDVSSGIQGTNPREKDAKKMAAFIAAVVNANSAPNSAASNFANSAAIKTASSNHLIRD
jgi:phosphoribosylanthranilate isomerase